MNSSPAAQRLAYEQHHSAREPPWAWPAVEQREDVARELGDEASLTASTTRALNLYRQSGLALEAFVEQLYAARQVTKERTATSKGRPKVNGQGYGPKNTMAYYFAVVEDLVGLRAEQNG